MQDLPLWLEYVKIDVEANQSSDPGQLTPEPPSFWATVDIMGHQRFVGYCSEVHLFGAKLLRIDCPPTEKHHSFYRLFSASNSLHSMMPLTQDQAMAFIDTGKHAPSHLLHDMETDEYRQMRWETAHAMAHVSEDGYEGSFGDSIPF